MSAILAEELEGELEDMRAKVTELEEQLDTAADEYRALDEEHDTLKEKWDSVETLITDLYHEI